MSAGTQLFTIIFSKGIRIVVVNALEILALDAEPRERFFARKVFERNIYVAHNILNKVRIVIRVLSHIFFVGAL